MIKRIVCASSPWGEMIAAMPAMTAAFFVISDIDLGRHLTETYEFAEGSSKDTIMLLRLVLPEVRALYHPVSHVLGLRMRQRTSSKSFFADQRHACRDRRYSSLHNRHKNHGRCVD
jgi:hypothetical protein